MRRLLLASVAILSVSIGIAQAQMVGFYIDNDTDFPPFKQMVWPTAGTRLTYVDSTLPMSGWVASAQYEASAFAASVTAGVVPMLGLPMAGAGEDADADFKAIASGSEDAALTSVLQAFADEGYQNIILRPGWEMNGKWFAWSVNAANAADYVAAFQHIAALAHNFTPALVTVVFNPNTGNDSGLSVDAYYPGDPAVDVIALDGYDPAVGGPQPLDTSRSATNLTYLWVMQVFAPAHHKPFGICETGGLSSNAGFPAQLSQAIQQAGNAVLFLGIWDSASDGDRITDNPTTAAAWQALALQVSQGNGIQIASISQDYTPPPISAVPVAASPAAPVAAAITRSNTSVAAPRPVTATAPSSLTVIPTVAAVAPATSIEQTTAELQQDRADIATLTAEVSQLTAEAQATETGAPSADAITASPQAATGSGSRRNHHRVRRSNTSQQQ